MPDLAGNIEEIQNSLKASLGGGRDRLDQNVVAASKRVLLQSIEFKPASAPYSLQCNALKAKYTSLNPSSGPSKPWNGASEQPRHKPEDKEIPKATSMEVNEESLPRPKVVIFPEELVKMEWTARTQTRIGAGLVNMGNTCFFNSTLQCLTYTAPLVNYCMSNDHRQKCKKKDFCMMCEIQVHMRTSLECGGRSIKPHSMLQKLRCIAKHMKWGRQEDAHEFLRFLVDHLQQACLHGETKIDKLSKETTVINQIFGGYLRSQVTCLRCQAKSNTFDPFMDLSLDIKGVSTVEDALTKFVKPETLDMENAYKCPKCRNKVRAHKRFSIQKPPNILTIQLNRFDFNRHLSGKINRFIKYPERINLRNYMSQRQGEPILYHLYGVLVHSGHSSDCGHYYSYVKSPSKTWYCMNDSIVHQANNQSVFSADAYVLFYARVNRSSSAPSTPSNKVKVHSQSLHSTTPNKNSFIGPVLPNHMKPDKSPLTNGVQGKSSSEAGMPVARISQTNNSKIVHSAASSLPDAHKKISFPILTPQQKKLQQMHQEDKEDGKRIVLQIKHGNSTTMEKSPDGKSKVVNGNITTLPWLQKTTGLVPYNDDDSDAEQENKDISPAPSSTSNSLSAAVKNLRHQLKESSSVTASGDYMAVKSSGRDSSHLALPNKAGDNKISPPKTNPLDKTLTSGKSNHLSQPSSSKSPFVWEGSDSTSRLSHLKTTDKDRVGHSKQGPSTSSLSSPINHKSPAKPNLALDVGAASASKLKSSASGNWFIHPQEGAPSPRGSCSSTNSVNSTSEWNVESKSTGAQASGPSDTKSSSQLSALNSGINGSVADKQSACTTLTSEPSKGTAVSKPSSSYVKTHTHQSETKKTLLNNKDSPPRSRPSKAPSRDGSLTPVDISDRQSLLSPSSSSNNNDSYFKKLSKLKNHKLVQSLSSVQDRERSSSSPSDTSSSRKSDKKKKKKNKKHKKLKERDSSDSDTDDNIKVSSKKAAKGNVSKRPRDSASSKGSSSSGEEGYEWVEKTIQTTPGKAKSNHVSAQAWNQGVKDDLSIRDRQENGGDGGKAQKSNKAWDGARHSRVDSEFGVTQDYNSRILSWDGGKSQLTRDLEEDRDLKRKRHWSDDYNEEMDAGKVKKVKNHREDTGYGSYNPFQEFNHHKKSSKYGYDEEEGENSWSQDHSYYQHRKDHQHHHHSNGNNGHSRHNNNNNNWYSKSYKYNNNSNNNNNKVNGSRKFYK